MAQYRLKAATVEAVQWDGTEADADRIIARLGDERFLKRYSEGRGLVGFGAATPDGWVDIALGDWIVVRPSGEFSTGSDEAFNAAFEPVPVVAISEVHDDNGAGLDGAAR